VTGAHDIRISDAPGCVRARKAGGATPNGTRDRAMTGACAGDSQLTRISPGTDCIRSGGACGAEAVRRGGTGCGQGADAQETSSSAEAAGARGNTGGALTGEFALTATSGCGAGGSQPIRISVGTDWTRTGGACGGGPEAVSLGACVGSGQSVFAHTAAATAFHPLGVG
jgi:hypothetical protein